NGRLVHERRLGSSPDAVALAAILAKPWADVVLSGAATVETLRSNLRALVVQAGEVGGLREDRAGYVADRRTPAWDSRARPPTFGRRDAVAGRPSSTARSPLPWRSWWSAWSATPMPRSRGGRSASSRRWRREARSGGGARGRSS